MCRALILLGALVLASAANAAAVYYFFNGEKLLNAAAEWEKTQTGVKGANLNQAAGYAGYVGALFDYLSDKQRICSKGEQTKAEVLEVVTHCVKQNDKRLDRAASVFVEDCLYKKYRCN